MTKPLAAAALALSALALAAPSARADWGIRGGLEAPLVTHTSNGSYGISDSIQPAIDVLVLKSPKDLIGFGLEGSVGFAASGSGYQRTGSSVGPALIINVPALPLYARASVPLRVEPDALGVNLRLAAGLSFSIPVVGIYIEAACDMPLAGKNVGGSDVSAFNYQRFSLGAGVSITL